MDLPAWRGHRRAPPVGADAADLAGITVTAALKPAVAGNAAPSAAVPAVAQLAAEARADIGGLGAGWLLSLAAGAAEVLAPGSYATNARLAWPGGAVLKSDTLIIRIVPAT